MLIFRVWSIVIRAGVSDYIKKIFLETLFFCETINIILSLRVVTFLMWYLLLND